MTANQPPILHTIEILDKLISFQSVSTHDNLELIQWIQGYLLQYNVESEIIEYAAGKRVNLLAKIGPSHCNTDKPYGVMLSGHSDVVPTKGQNWESDPFRLIQKKQRLYARGSADMKGFIACLLATVPTMQQEAIQEPIWIAISCDEEIGCLGVRPMIEKIRRRNIHPRLVIIGEPTMMQPVIGHKGKWSGQCICKGQAGHSSYAPELASAIHLASDMIQQVAAIQKTILQDTNQHDERYPIAFSSLNVGNIVGGQALNIVPEHCDFTLEIRHLPNHDPSKIIEQLNQVAFDLSDKYRSNADAVCIKTINTYPGLEQSNNADGVHLVKRFCNSNDDFCVNFGTEAGLFKQQLESDCVVCGPGDISVAHKANEYIEIEQIQQCLQFLKRITAFCKG